MIRIVLDTSVPVSAVIPPKGPNSQVFDLIVAEHVRAYVTSEVLVEYARVFDYERLKHLDRRRIGLLRNFLENISVKVKPRGRLKISSHEEDNRIYVCAVAAKAHYIVTENAKHFTDSYKTTKIVTARQLVALFDS